VLDSISRQPASVSSGLDKNRRQETCLCTSSLRQSATDQGVSRYVDRCQRVFHPSFDSDTGNPLVVAGISSYIRHYDFFPPCEITLMLCQESTGEGGVA